MFLVLSSKFEENEEEAQQQKVYPARVWNSSDHKVGGCQGQDGNAPSVSKPFTHCKIMILLGACVGQPVPE
jgi:hypothetical protein